MLGLAGRQVLATSGAAPAQDLGSRRALSGTPRNLLPNAIKEVLSLSISYENSMLQQLLFLRLRNHTGLAGPRTLSFILVP